MAEQITLKSIEKLLDDKLEPINIKLLAIEEVVSGHTEQLNNIKETVDSHTNSLDAIVKNTSDWKIEMAVMRGRLDRYETVIKLLAKKLNLDVENILH